MALEGGEWSAARPGRTLPPGKTRYPFYGRLGRPQGWSGLTENLVPTGIRFRTVQPAVSHYTDWATRPIQTKQGQKNFLFPKMPRPALRPNQPPTEWVLGSIQGCTVAKAWRSQLSSPSYKIMYEYIYTSTSLYPSRCVQDKCTFLLPLCPMADRNMWIQKIIYCLSSVRRHEQHKHHNILVAQWGGKERGQTDTNIHF